MQKCDFNKVAKHLWAAASGLCQTSLMKLFREDI